MSPRTKEQNQEIREQTRQQIIDAAFELFANEGYAKTSIAAVAKTADVSKGLIYHYFSSKQDILEAIFDQLVDMGDQMMTFPENYSAKQKLQSVLTGIFRFIEEQPNLGRLMVGLALQKDAFSTLKPKIDEVSKHQIELFAAIMEEAGFPQPRLEAYKLGAMMDGILLAYVASDDEYPLQEIKQKIMDDYVPE